MENVASLSNKRPSTNVWPGPYKYVVYDQVYDYFECGWHLAAWNLGGHRNEYSVLMVWCCDCTPAYPLRRDHHVERTSSREPSPPTSVGP